MSSGPDFFPFCFNFRDTPVGIVTSKIEHKILKRPPHDHMESVYLCRNKIYNSRSTLIIRSIIYLLHVLGQYIWKVNGRPLPTLLP